MPRMLLIAGVRQAEPWSIPNIIGAAALLVAFIVCLIWLIRRYLDG